MGSGEVAIVALSTMISLKVTFSDGLGGRKELWFYRVGVMACLCRSVDVWFVEFFIEKTGRAFCVNQRAILWFL